MAVTSAAASLAYIAMASMWPVVVALGDNGEPLDSGTGWLPYITSPISPSPIDRTASTHDAKTRWRAEVAHSGHCVENVSVISVSPRPASMTACLYNG